MNEPAWLPGLKPPPDLANLVADYIDNINIIETRIFPRRDVP